MATLVQNANAVASCATAIDAAIVAKGGTLVGGGKLRNAAAGIDTISTGGTISALTVTKNGTYTASGSNGYSPVTVEVDKFPKPWRNDEKTHFWYYVEDGCTPCYVVFNAKYKSDGHTFTVDWGDGTVDTIAASSDYTQRNLGHYYTEPGTYVATIGGYDAMLFRFGSSWGTSGNSGLLALRQIELYAEEYEVYDTFCQSSPIISIKFESSSQNTQVGTIRSLAKLRSIYGLEIFGSLNNTTFYYDENLRIISDLSNITSIPASTSFHGSSRLTDLYFSSKTHTDVEGITNFTYFPNLGTQCIFHCSDGDYYRSGTSLIAVS